MTVSRMSDTIELVGETDITKVMATVVAATAPEVPLAAAEAKVAEARKIMGAKAPEKPEPAPTAGFDAEEMTAAEIVELPTVSPPPPTISPPRYSEALHAAQLAPVNVLPAMDETATGEGPAPYVSYDADSVNTSAAEYNLQVKTCTDSVGRTFYEFDDGKSKALVVCVFKTIAGELIALNGVVMPMADFQQIVYVRTQAPKKGRVAKESRELRAAPPVLNDTVHCTLKNGQTLMLPNTTVKHVMMALQHLAPPPSHIETEVDEDEMYETEEYVGPLRRFFRWLY